jgi:hypothetical protein
MSDTPNIQVKIRSLEPFRYLFPKARVLDQTVSMGATVADTVNFIPRIIQQCSWQARKFVNQELKGLPVYEALKKLWHFVKYHVAYEKDVRGIEQVRSPRRLIHDGKGDCDCMTTFVDCCLKELKINNVINRITRYKENYWQHIYPIVPFGNGKYITMDCVADYFNYEVPYTKKEDHPMELQFLDGIDDTPKHTPKSVDGQGLFGKDSDLAELGRLFKKRTAAQKAAAKQRRRNFGKKLTKGVHILNKINPATVLLRAGMLASMKLNVMKVAEKIKWAYATPEYAKSKGMDMAKYDRLKRILDKAQQIFYVSGGKPENLKKAILTGRGNRNHEIAGVDGYSESTELPQLLGAIYQDEFVNGMDGYENGEGLGIVTATAVAAASTAMGALAALLKSIGDLFPKKNKASAEDVAPDDNSAPDTSQDSGGDNNPGPSQGIPPQKSNTEETPPSENNGEETPSPDALNTPEEGQRDNASENLPAPVSDETEVTPSEETTDTPADNSDNSGSSETPANTEEEVSGLVPSPLMGIKDFYDKNKSWILPVGVVAGAIMVVLAVDHFSSKSKAKQSSANNQYAINGFKKKGNKKRKKKKGGSQQNNPGKQSVIALM